MLAAHVQPASVAESEASVKPDDEVSTSADVPGPVSTTAITVQPQDLTALEVESLNTLYLCAR